MCKHQIMASAHEYRHHLGYLGLLLLERWVGRTEKVDATNLLDLAFDVIVGIIKWPVKLILKLRKAPLVVPPIDKETPK